MTVIKRPGDEPLFGGKSVVMFGRGKPSSKPFASPDIDPTIQILDAALFAARKHRNQRRKDVEASPYINHPLALAHLLATVGGVTDPTILCAALLHDTVEDTETTPEELEQRFGPMIAEIVMEVTDDKNLDKDVRKSLQITNAAGKSHEAKLVKMADKISNLGDILQSPPAEWPVSRKLEYFEWAGQVIDGLRGTNVALEETFDELLAEGRREFGPAR